MQSKRAPAPRRAPDRQLSLHRFRNAPGQGQPQARSVNLCGRHEWAAIERLENMRQIRRVDADSTIRNADLDFLATQTMLGEPSLNADPALFTTVLQRVGDQILHAL